MVRGKDRREKRVDGVQDDGGEEDGCGGEARIRDMVWEEGWTVTSEAEDERWVVGVAVTGGCPLISRRPSLTGVGQSTLRRYLDRNALTSVPSQLGQLSSLTRL